MSNIRLPLPCAAYTGKEPYIFISYAHVDGDRVYPEIKALHDRGYRIWYDEGIGPSKKWLEEIASAIDDSAIFIVFITRNAIQSDYVDKEVTYAIDERKLILPVYLEEVSLPKGWKLGMGDIQAIMKWRMSEDDYLRKIIKALPGDCLVKSGQALAHNVNISYSIEPDNNKPKIKRFEKEFQISKEYWTKTKDPSKAEIPSPVLPLKPEKSVSVKGVGLNNPKLIIATISGLILLSVLIIWTVNKPATKTITPSQNKTAALKTDEEPKPTTPIQAVIQFHSRLILWGTFKGHAVIGLDPSSNTDTKLVKAGDVIEGETIMSIGNKYIVVKNQTGLGKIKITGEQYKIN